ncbi:hypothetical protein ACRQ5B_05070 [Pseudarthrobacter sp. L19]|uniref:hypothetical protein n=1 Tax=Pseudarthrobacter sp. L19 TaxID=3423951 RepID=UPI003D799CDF
MKTIEWWPKLDAEARAWLIEHNGEVIAADVENKIAAAAGGTVTSDAWWIADGDPREFTSPTKQSIGSRQPPTANELRGTARGVVDSCSHGAG